MDPLRLRAGRRTAIDQYAKHGRITGGPREEILDALYTAWRADIDAGRTSVMVAADAATVAELNSRARADRVASGSIGSASITTSNGTTIGVGDLVVTRRNNRDLTVPGGWVKNGDTWTVASIGPDDSATLTRCRKRPGGSVSVELPAAYVTEHLDLGYAMTAHRAQGRTVDVAHAYVNATTAREPLYVMATRGREANLLYVDTTYDPDRGTAHDHLPEVDSLTVLRGVCGSGAGDVSALTARAEEAKTATSPTRVAAEGAALHALARERRYTTALLAAGYSSQAIEDAKSSDQWRRIVAVLTVAEKTGGSVEWLTRLRRAGDLRPALPHLEEALGALPDATHERGHEVQRVRRFAAGSLLQPPGGRDI